MSPVLPFLILCIATVVIAAAVLLIVTYAGMRELRQRIEHLEKTLRDSRSRPESLGPLASERGATTPIEPREPEVRTPIARVEPAVPLPPLIATGAKAVPDDSSSSARPLSPSSSSGSIEDDTATRRPGHAPTAGAIGTGAGVPAGGSAGRTPGEPRRPQVPASGGMEWERWIGVRGAAVVGAVVLGIAALLFFQYSIENNLITPAMRIGMGVAVGVACFLGAELLRKREYDLLANAITGAGAAVLYAASWAAFSVFEMWSFGMAFTAMVVVTVACCLLAHRHSSQLIAVLGLVGGFATPLVLSRGQDNPIGLFGYVLLVNLGFLFVANKRRWPAIGLVGLLGTFVIQAMWIFGRMRPETFAIGLVIVGVFALVFAVFMSRQPASERSRWMLTQAGALLLPFVFAIYFAQSVDGGASSIGWHLYPTALLCALLCAAASWMARAQNTPFVAAGAAAGTAAMVLVWIVGNEIENARAWELVLCSLVLALVLHVFCEWRPKARTPEESGSARELQRGHVIAASALDLGLFAGLIVAAGQRGSIGLLPVVLGFVAFALLLSRIAALGEVGYLHVIAAIATGVGIGVWSEVHELMGQSPEPLDFMWLLAALTAMFHAIALARRSESGRRMAWRAAVCIGALAIALLDHAQAAPTTQLLAFMLGFGFSMAVAAAGARSGVGLGIGAVMCALFQSVLIAVRGDGEIGLAREELALVLTSAALFTFWPLVRRGAWRESKSVWCVAACSTPLWYFVVQALYSRAFTREHMGVVAIALAAIPGIAFAILHRTNIHPERGVESREATPTFNGTVWYAAVALAFVSLAIPLDLDRDVVPVSAALYGLALVGLWKRFEHEPLHILVPLLLVFSTIASIAPRFVGAFESYESALVNWLSYTFLVPAAAAILAAIWMRPLEIARTVAAAPLFGKQLQAPGAAIASTCGLVLVFAWINLVIVNAFGRQPRFDWFLERMPARDMTVSIAWAVYALTLLGLGVAKKNGGLRWASLVLLISTIGKVFLFDLGSLGGLYRVASLFGLAVSLLLVSLLYQRFVFRKTDVPAT